MKDIMTILHYLFVFVLYAGSAINLIASVPNRDTYNLAMAILLYITATKQQKSWLEESEDQTDD
jgi:hypothetical protein